jgi:signal transduction histidine kinase
MTLAVAGVLGLSLSTFSLFLDTAFERALRDQFDARLAQDARAVGSMVEDHGYGGWEFESGPLLGFEEGPQAAYFQVWSDQGTTIGRSPSLADRDLPRDGIEPGVGEGTLPDGRRGRWLRVDLAPRWDPGVEAAFGARKVNVLVGRGTEDIEAAVARLRWLLWGSSLTAMVLATLAGAIAVRHGLAPIDQLGLRADAIDARRLDERLPSDGIPEELRPAVVKLNELLARLQASFDRERRFGADAGHELRTPLAGLRSILEVARSRERAAVDYRKAIDEALAVTRQLSALVESLLTLAHLDAGPGGDPSTLENILLSDLVTECYAPFTERARSRDLDFQNRVPIDVSISSDRERLRIVIQNLVANAVDYTVEGGTVLVESDPSQGVLLEIKDSGPAIPDDALEKIFDRFFRLDPSRSATGEHWGIGLALARALCGTLDLSLSVENQPNGWLTFQLRSSDNGHSLGPKTRTRKVPGTIVGRSPSVVGSKSATDI